MLPQAKTAFVGVCVWFERPPRNSWYWLFFEERNRFLRCLLWAHSKQQGYL